MKRLAIFIVSIMISFNMKADFIKGQKLNVLAKSGLTLRTAPIAGEAIDVIPFRSRVTVLQSDEDFISSRVEWIHGNWILVEYDGLQGYVHDGFLTDLSIPEYDFEHNQMDMDLIYPLESYIDYRMGQFAENPDTTLNTRGGFRVTQEFENGKLLKEDRGDIYKVELYLDDARLMDVYQILSAMYDDPLKRNSFENRSVFIQDESGDVSQVKVSSDELINIRKMPNGQIRLRILTSESGCQ